MSTTTSLHVQRRLPNIYTFDAIYCAVAGLVMIFGASVFSTMLDPVLSSTALVVIGLVLFPWGLYNYWCGRQPALNRLSFGIHMAVDWGWIAASLVILAFWFSSMSVEGKVLLLLTTLSVFGVVATKLATTKLTF